ncbi:hypothetical protein HZH66_011130 [Vespula vulgaris]|uniref:Uncharacterized protein n=1 Tax=Vespula vulgaris TaxID=7454 RepID=A0A834JEC3_VESVU|nr:hypothetical protein HZH66_011130 [Vespula vulgaris]
MQNVLRVGKLEELVARVVDSRVFRQEDEQEGEEKRKRKKVIEGTSQRMLSPCSRFTSLHSPSKTHSTCPVNRARCSYVPTYTIDSQNGPKADRKRTECGKNGRKARLVRLIVLGSSTRTTRSTLGMAIWRVVGQTFLIFRNSFKLNSSTERADRSNADYRARALWTRGLSLAGRIDRKPVGNC